MMAGHMESLEQAFQAQVAKHPEYTVKQRIYITTTFQTEPEENGGANQVAAVDK
jgi:hypothetical protein